MYSYMGLIMIIIVGFCIGLSYLITDYFFRTKEAELNQKGSEVALIVRYFNTINTDNLILRQYLTSVDQLIGARIWVFDADYSLRAASESRGEMEEALRNVHDEAQERRLRRPKSVEAIDKQLREGGPLNDRVQEVLARVYAVLQGAGAARRPAHGGHP